MDRGASFSLRERMRYKFDNLLGRGPVGMVLLLAGAALVVLVIAAVLLSVLGIRDNEDNRFGFIEGFWQAMLRAMDAGAMGADTNWPLRLASLVITIAGIFIVSSLIGILIAGLDARLTALQRGRGKVAVAGHTLLLGWSPKVFTIISELNTANANQRGAHVVVLADRDKQEMDELIGSRLAPAQRDHLTVVTRRGVPSESSDLALVNPQLAKSIIVLADESAAGDAAAVKTALSLLHEVGLASDVPLVVEISSAARAKALQQVTEGRVAIVRPADVIARTAAQGSRETGLNLVFQELFDFAGDEIYFAGVPQAVGARFGAILNNFPESTALGLRRADGTILLHPADSEIVAPGDKIIFIAADDDSVRWADTMPATLPRAAVQAGRQEPRKAEHMVAFGWNDYGREVVGELDKLVAAGSRLTLVVDPQLVPADAVDLPEPLFNLEVAVRMIPDSADPVGTVLGAVECDNVLILCYRGEVITAEEAGSRSLMTFLEARSLLAAARSSANVTAELIDERDVALIPTASAAEFMVSERLASLMMSQLSENVELARVFADLLDSDGSELYCKPFERYATAGVQLRFADLVLAAQARGELAIGWQLAAARADSAAGFGVRVNPGKAELVTFGQGDQLIVLAPEDS